MRSRDSASAIGWIPATGERNYAVIQAEDELAAIGMVLGAAWNGARAFTPTSGPGHLADERIRGPRLLRGSALRDLRRAAGRPLDRHADAHAAMRTSCCAPTPRTATPATCCCSPPTRRNASTWRCRRSIWPSGCRRPVFVLSDLDIGMNDWMCRDLKWDDAYRPDRGKMLSAEELAELDKFYRYVDRDDDAHHLPHAARACIRRAPTSRAARATTSTAAYTEDSAEYQVVLDRLKRKFATAARYVPQARDRRQGRQQDRHCERRQLRRRGARGASTCSPARRSHVDYLRVRGFPFGDDVESFLSLHATIFVVEQNRDAQLRSLLTLETAVDKSKLKSILSYSGFPMSCEPIVDGIRATLPDAPRLTAVSRRS